MTKPTPGTWFAGDGDERDQFTVFSQDPEPHGNGGTVIVEVAVVDVDNNLGDEEARANALLMAAAKELLDACQVAVETLTNVRIERQARSFATTGPDKALSACHQAIAKAKGLAVRDLTSPAPGRGAATVPEAQCGKVLSEGWLCVRTRGHADGCKRALDLTMGELEAEITAGGFVPLLQSLGVPGRPAMPGDQIGLLIVDVDGGRSVVGSWRVPHDSDYPALWSGDIAYHILHAFAKQGPLPVLEVRVMHMATLWALDLTVKGPP